MSTYSYCDRHHTHFDTKDGCAYCIRSTDCRDDRTDRRIFTLTHNNMNMENKTLYTARGEKILVVKRFDDGSVAGHRQTVCISPEGIEYVPDYTDLFLFNPGELYESPPTADLDERIVKLKAELEKVKKDIAFHRKADKELEQQIERRMEEWESVQREFPELYTLQRFLRGEIKYYFFQNTWAPQIIEVDASISEYARTNMKPDCLRLLSLFGKSDGDLEWRLNRYRDGSGDWCIVIPCATENEAIAHAREWIASLNKIPNSKVVDSFVKKWGLVWPEHLLEKQRAEMIEARRKKVEEHRSLLAQYQKQLHDLERPQ